jgi:hypothetical protein
MRPQKITLGEMRIGRGGVLVYCADCRCGHHITLAAETVDQWPGDVRLSDLEPKFICQKCGRTSTGTPKGLSVAWAIGNVGDF